jgi:hypothetical protein
MNKIEMKHYYIFYSEIDNIMETKTYEYIPNTPTQKNTLNKILLILNNYQSNLHGKYNTITTASIIKCNCSLCKSTSDIKIKTLYSNNQPICISCLYKKRYNTIKEQNIVKYGVDNVSKLQEIKHKKYITASNNGHIITIDKFIELCKQSLLSNVWIYCIDEYFNYDTPIYMMHKQCKKIWLKTPSSHIKQDNINTKGQGCLYCYQNSKRLTKNRLIEVGINKYGDQFIYDDTIPDIIKNNKEKIHIYCKDHGLFQTTYNTHLYGKGGCISCSNNLYTKKEFIAKYIIELNNNKINIILDSYLDDDIIYINKKYDFTCLLNTGHSSWNTILGNIIYNNSGCPECSVDKIKLTNLLKYDTTCTLNTEIARDSLAFVRQSNKDEINEKRKETCLTKFGYSYPIQSPEIYNKILKNSYLYKDYITPKGNIRRIQGYENYALDELFNLYDENEIITTRSDIPQIKYSINNKEHIYYPDIFIKSINKLIEVKSTWTFNCQIEETLIKTKQCIINGYLCEIWIYSANKNKHVIVP